LDQGTLQRQHQSLSVTVICRGKKIVIALPYFFEHASFNKFSSKMKELLKEGIRAKKISLARLCDVIIWVMVNKIIDFPLVIL
jgi:hypothetical protein